MTNLAIKFLVSTFTLVSMLTEFVSNEKKLLIKKLFFYLQWLGSADILQ